MQTITPWSSENTFSCFTITLIVGQEKNNIFSCLAAYGPYEPLGPMALWALWPFGPYGPLDPMALGTLWPFGPMALWTLWPFGPIHAPEDVWWILGKMMNTREDDEYNEYWRKQRILKKLMNTEEMVNTRHPSLPCPKMMPLWLKNVATIIPYNTLIPYNTTIPHFIISLFCHFN